MTMILNWNRPRIEVIGRQSLFFWNIVNLLDSLWIWF